MTEVKGRALKSIQKYIEKKFGKEGFQQWMDAISVEAYTIYSGPIETNEWFSLRKAMIEPMANVAQLFYKWDLKEAAWDFGRASADMGLKGPYRLLFKMGSTKFLVQKAPEYMSTYYRPSEITLPQIDENSATVHITKLPEIDKTVEYRICGWIERALEINGANEITINLTKSLAQMDKHTEIKINWQ